MMFSFPPSPHPRSLSTAAQVNGVDIKARTIVECTIKSLPELAEAMPLNFLGTVITEGTQSVPYYESIKRYGPYVLTLAALKRYFSGTNNNWERDLHGRVVIITGGTSGVGACVAREVAQRGAQVVLLVRKTADEWLVNYINDLRDETGNHLIYAEEANLGDLYSIRKFVTNWLNNTPPRRLDMVICCAGAAIPPSVPRAATQDGVEYHLQINYLAHYHLLTLLSPALRAQPPDRDVRIILTSCVSNVMADFDMEDLEFSKRGYPLYRPWRVIGASKLALCMFGYELQRRLMAYERPDKCPQNVHVAIVDPGMMRSPSFKRFASMGTLLGLFVYLLLWPIWWLFLKTSVGGAQSLLFAAMSPEIRDQEADASYVSECRIRSRPPRKELSDVELQQKFYDLTEKTVVDIEKKSVIARKRTKGHTNEASRADSETPPEISKTDSEPSTTQRKLRKRSTKV
jgi:NAD(P)-dependent dehydrogenase (short-subunit alcohol dehydrogenase family)